MVVTKRKEETFFWIGSTVRIWKYEVLGRGFLMFLKVGPFRPGTLMRSKERRDAEEFVRHVGVTRAEGVERANERMAIVKML